MAELVKDPVCGMEIDPETAAGKSEHQGTTYYFCADGCKTDFDADPAKYIGGGAAAATAEPATPSAEPAAAAPAGGAAAPATEPPTAGEEPATSGGSEKRWWEFWK